MNLELSKINVASSRIRVGLCAILAIWLAGFVFQPLIWAQEKKASEAPATKSTEERDKGLEEMLSNVKLTGLFTVDGKDLSDVTEESYEIESAKKLSGGDDWAIKCRIKYGEHDVSIPIIVQIKWADQTPVITVDDLTIPAMGTFSARVVFHDQKYAGTWSHDEVGGHLFGRLEKNSPNKESKE